MPTMAEVHQLILQYGIEEARRQAATKHERQVIEAAYQVLSDDAERMGSPTRFCASISMVRLCPQAAYRSVWKREWP